MKKAKDNIVDLTNMLQEIRTSESRLLDTSLTPDIDEQFITPPESHHASLNASLIIPNPSDSSVLSENLTETTHYECSQSENSGNIQPYNGIKETIGLVSNEENQTNPNSTLLCQGTLQHQDLPLTEIIGSTISSQKSHLDDETTTTKEYSPITDTTKEDGQYKLIRVPNKYLEPLTQPTATQIAEEIIASNGKLLKILK